MKLLFVTLTVLFSFIGTKSTAADDTVVSAVVLENFKSSFTSATEVRWSHTENLYKAEFSYNGQFVSAFYDENGGMIAVTRNVSSMQLPIPLQASLKSDYSAYWISDLFELTDNNGTSYYVTIEKADAKVVLKSAGSYGWTTFQKQKKS